MQEVNISVYLVEILSNKFPLDSDADDQNSEKMALPEPF
jgi:hypothetical protein